VIKLNTFNEELLTLSAGVVKELDFKQYNPNVFLIRNISSANVYIGESPVVSSTNYYKKCLANTSTKYVSVGGIGKLYLYCASSITNSVLVQSMEQENLTCKDLDEDTSLSAAISGISLGSVKILDSGGTNELAIDSNGYITSKLSGAIPAGSNSIGKVSLDAGSNSIGKVGINTGSNVIGLVKLVDTGGTNELSIDSSGYLTVKLDGSSSLPAGSNIIGGVGIVSSIPAGTNNIGDVDIASSIPAGTNDIGKVVLGCASGDVDSDGAGALKVAFTGSLTASSVKIEDSDSDELEIENDGSINVNSTIQNSIPAGTNNIGDVDILSVASGQNLKPATTPAIYNKTCTTASTEYNQPLPANCKGFTIGLKSKDDSVTWVLKFATSGTEFSFSGNESYTLDNILFSSQTLYFETDKNGEVIQIIANA
jgi:hypothetical protein